MAYFTGRNLDSRAAALGLSSLQLLLSQVKTLGMDSWPGPCTIKPLQQDSGPQNQLRSVLYSLLHQVGLKDHFSISRLPGGQGFVLDRRYDLAAVVSLDFQPPQPPQPQPQYGEEGEK